MRAGDYRTIVAGYNGTEACKTAVRQAAAVAAATGATLHVVSVGTELASPGGAPYALPYEAATLERRQVRSRAREGAALAVGVRTVVPHAFFGVPAREILRLAAERDASLIVLGRSRHRVLERLFLGTTADRVVRLAPVPCLLPVAEKCPARLLVAVDDSLYGENALRAALVFAALTGAEVRCVHVLPPPADEARSALAHARAYFAGLVAGLREDVGVQTPPPAAEVVLRAGRAADEVLAEAEAWGADLVVTGSHGRGFLERAILGSTSERILRGAPAGVLVVPSSR